jgi:hypothetical protein
VELYLHSPIRLHGLVFNEAQGHIYLTLITTNMQHIGGQFNYARSKEGSPCTWLGVVCH